MFYTSGDDRIFPKGFPAAVVRVVRRGQQFQEIIVEPTGLQHGLEEVLILLNGVHQTIPAAAVDSTPVYIAPPPPEAAPPVPVAPQATGRGRPRTGTAADRLLERYREIGEAQNHRFGDNPPGTKAVNFNIALPPPGAAATRPSRARHRRRGRRRPPLPSLPRSR